VSTLAADRFNAAVAGMLGHLTSFLPVAVAPAPQSTLALVEAAERPVGVGAFAGNVERGPLAVLGVRGGRVEGRVRFDLRAATAGDAAAAALALQQAVRGARLDALKPWMRDFVLLEPAGGEPAALISPNDWRQGVEYRVLYEFHYEDPEGAGGLIVRIPVELRGEQHEDALVTRDLARWSAADAPPLRIRGPRAIGTLTALAFRGPAFPAGPVTLAVTTEGAGPATSRADLDAFALAVAGGGRNDEVAFADVAALLAAFTASGADVTLADGHAAPAAYQSLALVGPPVVPPAPPPPVARLAGVRLAAGEVLEVRYRNPALLPAEPQHFPPASESVVYLRAGRGPSA
jgi:hypothetical protein